MAQGMNVEEQREQERQNARTEAAVAEAISANDLEVTLTTMSSMRGREQEQPVG
jgi:hypothetical protein